MSFIITEKYASDYSLVEKDLTNLVEKDLTNNEIDKNTLEAIERLKCLDHLPSYPLDHKRVKMLCHAVELRITEVALNCGLCPYFRVFKPLAVISGAGIAGLAASFVLQARGFNVVIAEKRKCFDRFNVINLNVETQVFLKEFNLLEIEKFVASRIKEHRCILVEKNKYTRHFTPSDVSELQLDESISFENFNNLFKQEGIYSVPIGKLQTFLAQNALKAGVNMFVDAPVRILSSTQAEGVSKVQIADRTLKPDLFFIAEGAHSKTAQVLEMGTTEVKNECTGENWIFGNMTYSGEETFVVSIIDASKKPLRIANVIFNAKSKVINIAVSTSNKKVPEDSIRRQICQTAKQAFSQAFLLRKMHSQLLDTVSKPVHVINRKSSPFSMGNVFCIGDSAGSSSPLAGLGGTLGLTLVPLAVKQLLDDYEKRSRSINENFNAFSEKYTTRWIEKSDGIKKRCIRAERRQNGN